MTITVLKYNAPWGPFTREQIEEGLGRGDFTVKYLAHAPGLNEWLPLGEVLDYVDRIAGPRIPTLPPVPPPRELPPVPQPIATKPEPPVRPPLLPPFQTAFDNPAPPPIIPPVVQRPAVPPPPKPEVPWKAAPFFPRAIAFFIDCAILFVPVGILYVIGALAIEIPGTWNHIDHESRMQEWELLKRNTKDLAWLVAVGFGWLYGAGLESSHSQATIGKRWMGIKVTDAGGERLGFLRATGRYVAKYLSALPCFLGFIMALFSSRNLTLHDRLSGTRAVRN
jgi:uncharacterized RDD family membrane protein YckC